MAEQLTPHEHDQLSTTIKLISETMGVSYGRAKECCLQALVKLTIEGRPSP